MKVFFRNIPAALLLLLLIATGCGGVKKAGNNNNIPPPLTASSAVRGYGLLSKVCGIWNGPVTSATALGGYPQWIVDFRPVSAAQVSAKNELDTLNDIFMSFFIVYDSSEYKLAFRNGGSFAGMKRVAYMACDSVTETSGYSYYRFVDFVKGAKRDIVEVSFFGDSMVLRAWTNQNNTVPVPTLHMEWRAGLQDTTACQAAKAAFSYPQKVMVQNFTSTFAGVTESIYYTLAGDPYAESSQPYLGHSFLSYTTAGVPAIPAGARVYLFCTTKPLISGVSIDQTSLKTRSRYVILSSPDAAFTFNYMHPGSYYLYAFHDADGNGTLSSGDYTSTANIQFTLPALGSASASAQINYVIP